MKSTLNKKNRKIRLGKKADEGYEYAAKIDFNKDFSIQLSRVIEEKEINKLIKKEVKEFKKLIKKFSRKEKNIQYYYETGKELLSFKKDKSFKKIARYSIFRRVFEEIPDIFPFIYNEKLAMKHLDIMYGLAHIKKSDLSKASWDQWYEIMKFKDIYKKPKIIKKILKECKFISSGPLLREQIKNLIK